MDNRFLAFPLHSSVWLYILSLAGRGFDRLQVIKDTIRDFVLKGAHYGTFTEEEINDWLSKL